MQEGLFGIGAEIFEELDVARNAGRSQSCSNAFQELFVTRIIAARYSQASVFEPVIFLDAYECFDEDIKAFFAASLREESDCGN